MRSNFNTIVVLVLLFAPALFAQDVITITDADIKPGDNLLWKSENIYLLDGFVFVDSTAVLNIEAGTVLKGKPGEGANASALIVARGAKLYANGTKRDPIIFTAEADDINDPEDLTQHDRGLWGGLIILGRASINVAGGVEQIEGIPITEPRGQYGGNNDDDGSGKLAYISVRHGGSNIGANNEINGVTFGGVGRGTEVHHIEVFANADDGYEFFGGTVSCKNLVSAYNGDDSFDWDQGFRGKGQFWYAIMSATIGNSAFECDGGTSPEDGEPYSIPLLSNVTAIGSGATSANAKNTPLVNLRDNSGGKFFNSIFMDARGHAANVEDLESGQDSRKRLEAGDIVFQNNIWFDFKKGIADTDDGQQFLVDYLNETENVNENVDPQLTAISRTEDGVMDPRPTSGSPAFSNVKDMEDDWYTTTNYRGAFGQGAGTNWLEDWTFLWRSGLVTDVEEDVAETLLTPKATLYPNPTTGGNVTLRFNTSTADPVSISIMNVAGAMVAQVAAGAQYPVGQNEVLIDAESIGVGAYLVLIRSVNGTLAVPMRILR